MRFISSLLALAALLAACAHETADPIVERALHLPPGQTQELDAWLVANPNANVEARRSVLSQLCDAHARVGRYAEAAAACEGVATLYDEAPEGLTQSIVFWRSLSGQPPIRVTGVIDAPLTYGWTGMGEVPVTIGDETLNWGVDTGAEISVLRASDAQRLGVRALGGEVDITGSTPGTATGGLAMVPLMRIGAAGIENVPVMVLPDEALTFEGRAVPPILGMPILYAFGQMSFSEHGARLHAGPGVAPAQAGAIVWNDAGIAIDLHLAGGPVRAHLDTGANTTEFHDSVTPLLSHPQRVALTHRRVRMAGVSGEIERDVVESPSLDIGVAGGTCTVRNVSFGEEDAGAQGRAGIDLVKACDSFVLDFATMTFGAQ